MSPYPAAFRQAELAELARRVERADRLWRVSAVALAFGLHVGLGAWMMYHKPGEEIEPPGEMEIAVDMAPAALSVASVGAGENAADATEMEEVETVDTPEEVVEAAEPPQEVAETEVAEAETVEPEVTEAETVEPEVATAEDAEVIEAPVAEEAEVVVAAPKPKPPPKLVKKAERKPDAKREVRREPPRQQRQTAQTAGTRGQAQAEIGGRGASASASDLNRYTGRVRAIIERRKRYPSAARPNQGTASVRFTIDRSGAVRAVSVVRSAGHPALDQQALSMAQRGGFPSIPPSVGRDSITMTVPINFNL